MAALKTELWDYAAQHGGEFPATMDQLPEPVRIADAASELTYFLTPGLTQSSPASVLIREPDIFPRRLLLMTDGTVVIEERFSGAVR
jgi:hypothetical protein